VMLIGLCGLAGSGKDSIAQHCIQTHGFVQLSFADVLKDVLSILFDWDRSRLDGLTPEDRAWREQPDEWWTTKCGFVVTPRRMMQMWGTDICRKHFDQKIWIHCLHRRYEKIIKTKPDSRVIVSDCRFEDECKMISECGGTLLRVEREYPDWYEMAKKHPEKMELQFPDVHVSEWGIVSHPCDYTIMNNGTLQQLYSIVDQIMDLISQ
jgi:hypothetical protein